MKITHTHIAVEVNYSKNIAFSWIEKFKAYKKNYRTSTEFNTNFVAHIFQKRNVPIFYV